VADSADRIEAWPLPVLLRAARRAYGSAIRADLDEAGCDDVPRNGIFVIAAIARTEAALSEIIGGSRRCRARRWRARGSRRAGAHRAHAGDAGVAHHRRQA
jgi:hypothetical protein